MIFKNSELVSFLIGGLLVLIIWLLWVLLLRTLRRKNIKENNSSENLTSFYWNQMAKIGSVYVGLCPECEGLGKERQPCPNCKDENDGKMVTPLRVLFEKYPDFFLSHIKKIEMNQGKVIL